MNGLTTPWGTYALTRHPEHPRDPLRAWDAADAYLLGRFAEPGAPELTGTVAVAGDRWGALTTALAGRRAGAAGPGGAPAARLVQITDSHLGREATRANLARAGLADAPALDLLTTRDTPPDRVDVLLVRVPKSLALLEDQLHRLAPALHEGSTVIGTGMVKEIHTSTLDLFERLVGPTRTSLAVRKARLVFSTPDPALPRPANPWPLTYALPEDAPGVGGRTVVTHAGVFCADRLDIGTRLFLRHLPQGLGAARVVDLGCGNGVVGLAVAVADPDAEVVFTDESYQAVASAEETFRASAPPAAKARFTVGDGMAELPDDSVDVVLCNPPFHSHQALTDATARRMFMGARRALKAGGELRVVGNRHLGYHVTLKRIFGNCDVVAGDPKFVVLRAVKSPPGKQARAGTAPPRRQGRPRRPAGRNHPGA
ncbi:50S rRNA methyltransferase [Streptomyces sp. CC53]|uniref:methyltransferase n=1 Tax=unclassified Streptomyces TaxID=2593676 RepID=UPI0008DD2895|nr:MULTISPECIES: methyltransferase [unclassified Streptomyces]OII64145.1 50S rRNA methyltransferase [Streptomyces sp. CC53]